MESVRKSVQKAALRFLLWSLISFSSLEDHKGVATRSTAKTPISTVRSIDGALAYCNPADRDYHYVITCWFWYYLIRVFSLIRTVALSAIPLTVVLSVARPLLSVGGSRRLPRTPPPDLTDAAGLMFR